MRKPASITSLRFHQILCKSGRVAWAAEDAHNGLLRELESVGVINRDDPRINAALEKSWVALSQATYAPARLRRWGYQFDDILYVIGKPKRQRPMPLDLSNLMGGN